MLKTILVINAATFSSVTLTVTGFVLVAIATSAGIAGGLSLINKVSHGIILEENYENFYGRAQQAKECFNKFFTKSSQDNVIKKTSLIIFIQNL